MKVGHEIGISTTFKTPPSGEERVRRMLNILKIPLCPPFPRWDLRHLVGNHAVNYNFILVSLIFFSFLMANGLSPQVKQYTLSLSKIAGNTKRRVMFGCIKCFSTSKCSPASDYILGYFKTEFSHYPGILEVTSPETERELDKLYTYVEKGQGGVEEESIPVIKSVDWFLEGKIFEKNENEYELQLSVLDIKTRAEIYSGLITIKKSELPRGIEVCPAYRERINKLLMQNKSKGGLKIKLILNKYNFLAGEKIRMKLVANKNCYIKIFDYPLTQGILYQIFPIPGDTFYHLIAGDTLYIPPINAKYEIKAQLPAGREIIKVFASQIPFPPISVKGEESGLTKFYKNGIESLILDLRSVIMLSEYYGETSEVIWIRE